MPLDMRNRSTSGTEFEDDNDSLLSASSSSTISVDDEDVNIRMSPNWCAYRHLIESHGFRLDTCRDVKLWYQQYWDNLTSQGHKVTRDLPGYTRACNGGGDNELCKDAGLPENLFRGTRCMDGVKVIIKAVHLRSREYDVVKYLSSPPLRKDPRNHLIPILDLIEVPKDSIAFIVMEEWSPQLVSETPRTLRLFLGALRQCIEVSDPSFQNVHVLKTSAELRQHAVFMHLHHVAHLDISIRNLLTDYNSHYAYIDFELSRRFDGIEDPRIRSYRGTELAPELERGDFSDPYKADVWALGVLIVHTCSMTGYHVPELSQLLRCMLSESFEQRPTAAVALQVFDSITRRISPRRLQTASSLVS